MYVGNEGPVLANVFCTGNLYTHGGNATHYFKTTLLQNSKEKTALSKLVGVNWCDIHKEWYK